MLSTVFALGLIVFSGAEATREKRQAIDTELHVKELCRDKSPRDYFRLIADDCRDVVRCADSGLVGIRCPHGLAFDIERQTCDWKAKVKNCDNKVKVKKAYPLLNTVEPLCDGETHLACGDGVCMEKSVFCDTKFDCLDESDENKDFCKEHDPNSAPICDPAECVLPDCFCYEPGKFDRIPNNMNKNKIPQMIMITFDDALNHNNMDLYQYIFNGNRLNPNDCTIKGTFFVSHKYTNYSAVQEMHRLGHEIAVHSISHNVSSYWVDATKETWQAEMEGGRRIINLFANISQADSRVYGVRSPYLKVGGNRQFAALQEALFLYDSSMVVPLDKGPLWPYILYYKMPYQCFGEDQDCPTRQFAIWEMPMNVYETNPDGYQQDNTQTSCAMVDGCFTNPPTPDEFYRFLDVNFDRHNGLGANNAPFGLYLHSAFLKNNPDLLATFVKWMDDILATRNDVYFVTMTQVLIWMQNPTPIEGMENFAPWKETCIPLGEPACPGRDNNCELTSKDIPGQTFRMTTCMPCPRNFPWLGDTTGTSFI